MARFKLNHKNYLWCYILISATYVICLMLTADLTVSWLQERDFITNEFVSGKTDIVVEEKFIDGVKSDVFVKNMGNIPIYVRCKVLAYWIDGDGVALSDLPVEGEDYSITYGSSSQWKMETDGFYYYFKAVDYEDGENYTSNLIEKCIQTRQYSDGRRLVVDILAQSIQAEPEDAAVDAWGVKPEEV